MTRWGEMALDCSVINVSIATVAKDVGTTVIASQLGSVTVSSVAIVDENADARLVGLGAALIALVLQPAAADRPAGCERGTTVILPNMPYARCPGRWHAYKNSPGLSNL